MTRDELLAARTTQWTDEERSALARVVAALRPSPRHLADVLDWLDDIAVRENVRPAAVLAEPHLQGALSGSGSAPDRLKRWKEALRRRRYPRLAAREQEFAAAVRALDLGRAVIVAPPAGFEGGALTLTIRASSSADLETALDRLDQARRSGALANLFRLLE